MLDIATIAAPTTANASLPRLDLATWRDRIRRFRVTRLEKREAEAAARAADKIVKSLRDELRAAIGPTGAAICGNMILSVKEGAAVAASITLADGRKIDWSRVTSLVIGSEIVSAAGASLFGGRSGSVDIEIAGDC